MKSRARAGAERRFTWLGVSSGIAIGPAHVLERGVEQVQEYGIAAAAVDEELERFASAVGRSENQVRKLRDKARGLSAAAAEELGYLLDVDGQPAEGEATHPLPQPDLRGIVAARSSTSTTRR